jgi:hypothetical protein
MSRLWFRALEWLGRIRIGYLRRTTVRVGRQDALDAQGTDRWKDFLSAEKLYDTWAPAPGSPWSPFHCVPLFAAVDRIPKTHIGPAPEPGTVEKWVGKVDPVLPPHARFGAPGPIWADSENAIFLDLPGPLSVEAAAWLVTAAGCQTICTFDNWPHPKGLLNAEDTLAALLRWASTVDDARSYLTPSAPPVWVCDNGRLGLRVGKPGEFDNRYFLDDSVLPGPRLLAANGIVRATYVSFGQEDVPLLDLEGYFAELLGAGIRVDHVDIADESLEPRPLSTPAKPRKPKRDTFRRSAAGGFGSEVPEPSSGGGG